MSCCSLVLACSDKSAVSLVLAGTWGLSVHFTEGSCRTYSGNGWPRRSLMFSQPSSQMTKCAGLLSAGSLLSAWLNVSPRVVPSYSLQERIIRF